MPTQTLLNIAALILTIAGTLLMFCFTPKISSQVIFYRRAEMPTNRRRDNQKQRAITAGMLMLLLACILQGIALYLPSGSAAH